jgi:hypothetical protein
MKLLPVQWLPYLSLVLNICHYSMNEISIRQLHQEEEIG